MVCPSLPGYGFSGKPSETGWGVDKIAQAWETLMRRLGYDRYGAQGGDWGAAVTTQIGRNRGHCIGIHLNMPIARPAAGSGGDLTEDEQQALAAYARAPSMGNRLFQAAIHSASDARLWTRRLAGGTTGLDRREVLGVDGLRRASRKRS